MVECGELEAGRNEPSVSTLMLCIAIVGVSCGLGLWADRRSEVFGGL